MKFLGSLVFALVLIGSTLLFAIIGTLIESFSASHQLAALFTYQNPLFRLLLWLYFINILFSALNRIPFQKKHLPFLSTHLGLLLLLLGVFCKNHFGIQGTCTLVEGSSTSSMFVPNSYSLHIESLEACTLIALNPTKLGTLNTAPAHLELTLLEWTPHAEERIESFIKGSWGHILGLPPFELKEIAIPSLITPEYQIYAGIDANSNALVFPGKPSLFFTQDTHKKEQLIAFNAQGERFTTPLNLDALYVYDKGYGGYAAFVKLPSDFPQLELIAPLTRSWKSLSLPTKREEATPCIRLLASSSGKSEIVTLGYDKFGQKLKWPILEGRYLMRFQSHMKPLPFHLRLHSARQVNYPGTTMPYSYEAKLSFDGQEATLSMNHVYEKKGYRFYLANMTPSSSGIQHVQIVVNHDPTKYFLTYPGGFFLAFGILLLYVQKRYYRT